MAEQLEEAQRLMELELVWVANGALPDTVLEGYLRIVNAQTILQILDECIGLVPEADLDGALSDVEEVLEALVDTMTTFARTIRPLSRRRRMENFLLSVSQFYPFVVARFVVHHAHDADADSM
ncbi:hypothetical protein F4804DRAFT_338766 [Jackrogersella minutella]|nr:hypothetical protein F4804DRAFT_338766 [Jackrogersella minutella]